MNKEKENLMDMIDILIEKRTELSNCEGLDQFEELLKDCTAAYRCVFQCVYYLGELPRP